MASKRSAASRWLVVATAVAVVGCYENADEPMPSAVVQGEFDIGTAIVGQEIRHEFLVHNHGTADLVLGEPQLTSSLDDATVTCTLTRQTIPPGAFATGLLVMVPQEPSELFQRGVSISTNDPQHGQISVRGNGVVAPLIHVQPEDWLISSQAQLDMAVSGTVHSVAREFVVTKCEHPRLRCTVTPLDPAAKDELRAKSAYAMRVEFTDESYVGTFDETLVIETDTCPPHSLKVRGYRLGPIRFVPPRGANASWSRPKLRLSFGSFPAKDGADATVLAHIRRSDADFNVRSVVVESPLVEVTAVERVEDSSDMFHVLAIKIQVVPGGRPQARTQGNPVSIVIRTTHPRAREIHLSTTFVSR